MILFNPDFSYGVTMKRYASLDFLRGFSILLMLVLHIISDTLDIDALTGDLFNLPLFQLVLLIILPFLGGMAGFFLLISSTGNMLSMQKQLKKGMDQKTLLIRQTLGGFLLLAFAMLSEALIGYHGTFGEIFKHLNDLSQGRYDQGLWRFLYFETVNAIAWCIIINGIIHAIITRDGKWKDSKKMMKLYGLLAVIVLMTTPVMWVLAEKIVPGYPYAIDPITGMPVLFGVIGKSSFGENFIRFLLGPLAASWEPIFPYLAVSFAGSIFGVYLSQEHQEIQLSTLKIFLKIGLGMFIVGVLGILLNLILVVNERGVDAALSLYILISEHRFWTVANGVPILGWLFQFLCLNGFGICGFVMMFRLVEFRGVGEQFAQKTKFIRRMGFIAFTVYTMQWIYNLFYFIVSSILTAPYVRLGWGGTLLVVLCSVLTFYVLTLGWEKIQYIGSLEWMIGTISNLAIPGKKSRKKQKWWQKGQLQVEDAFYNADWINIVTKDDFTPENSPDANLSFKLGRLGFIFFPFSFIALFLALNAEKTESKNPYRKKGKNRAIIGIISFLIITASLITLKISTFG